MANILTNWTLVFVGYASLFVLGFVDNSRSPYFPNILEELNLSDSAGAWFFAASSLLATFSGWLVPRLIRSLRLINVMRLGHILLGLGLYFFSSSESIYQLVAGAVVFGFGFGLINVGQNLLVLAGSNKSLRRQLLSGLHSVYALASLVSPFVIAFLSELQWNWRESFQAFMGLCVFGFFSSFVARPEKPITEADELTIPPKVREWLPICVALSFYVASEVALVTRLPLFMRREYGFSEANASEVLGAFFATFLTGRLLFTVFPFKAFSNRQILISGFLTTMGLYILGLAHSYWWLVACGISMAPCFGVAVDYLADRYKEQADHVVSMVLAVTGLFLVLMHFGLGFLTDLLGIRLAMFIGPAMLLFSCLIILREPAPQES